jgi:hypothetical protein
MRCRRAEPRIFSCDRNAPPCVSACSPQARHSPGSAQFREHEGFAQALCIVIWVRSFPPRLDAPQHEEEQGRDAQGEHADEDESDLRVGGYHLVLDPMRRGPLPTGAARGYSREESARNSLLRSLKRASSVSRSSSGPEEIRERPGSRVAGSCMMSAMAPSLRRGASHGLFAGGPSWSS